MEAIAISVVVGIVVIMWGAVQIVRMALAYEEKRLALKAGRGDGGRIDQVLAANEAEMSKLRARVEVLERLATDEDRRLSSDIERLRSEQRA